MLRVMIAILASLIQTAKMAPTSATGAMWEQEPVVARNEADPAALAQEGVAYVAAAKRVENRALESIDVNEWNEQEMTLQAMMEPTAPSVDDASCGTFAFGRQFGTVQQCKMGKNTRSCIVTNLLMSSGEYFTASGCDDTGLCNGMATSPTTGKNLGLHPIPDGGCITQPRTGQRIFCTRQQPLDGQFPNVECAPIEQSPTPVPTHPTMSQLDRDDVEMVAWTVSSESSAQKHVSPSNGLVLIAALSAIATNLMAAARR